jgi:hypothetical protein
MSDAIYASAVPSQPIKWAGEIGTKDFATGAPRRLWKCGHEHAEMKDAADCAQAFLSKLIADFDYQGLNPTVTPEPPLIRRGHESLCEVCQKPGKLKLALKEDGTFTIGVPVGWVVRCLEHIPR